MNPETRNRKILEIYFCLLNESIMNGITLDQLKSELSDSDVDLIIGKIRKTKIWKGEL